MKYQGLSSPIEPSADIGPHNVDINELAVLPAVIAS